MLIGRVSLKRVMSSGWWSFSGFNTLIISNEALYLMVGNYSRSVGLFVTNTYILNRWCPVGKVLID